MTQYRLTAAKPKNAASHLKSQFKLFEYDEAAKTWRPIGWKSVSQVTGLLAAGHDVRTGKVVGDKMQSGAAVEVELRIARNDTEFKISEMPDS